jgi:hypothetical protein
MNVFEKKRQLQEKQKRKGLTPTEEKNIHIKQIERMVS